MLALDEPVEGVEVNVPLKVVLVLLGTVKYFTVALQQYNRQSVVGP